MLALSLAILGTPRCLLLDEPSIGLAPNLVERMFEQVREVCKSHAMTAVLVEQNVAAAMKIADRVIIMNNGQIVFDGSCRRRRGRRISGIIFDAGRRLPIIHRRVRQHRRPRIERRVPRRELRMSVPPRHRVETEIQIRQRHADRQMADGEALAPSASASCSSASTLARSFARHKSYMRLALPFGRTEPLAQQRQAPSSIPCPSAWRRNAVSRSGHAEG